MSLNTANDAYPFAAVNMMFVTSKDGQRRAAMPFTDATFAQCFHGRMSWGNAAAIAKDGSTLDYPVMSEAEGVEWVKAERERNNAAAARFWKDRPDLDLAPVQARAA